MTRRIPMVAGQPDNRSIVRDLLASVGYRMIEATVGQTGVPLARERRPEPIRIDVQLPGIDAYAATRRIKADPELRRIPIIVVTYRAGRGRGSGRASPQELRLTGFRSWHRTLGHRMRSCGNACERSSAAGRW